ncbi:MAG: FxsA family protein [Myxococcota bacterium]
MSWRTTLALLLVFVGVPMTEFTLLALLSQWMGLPATFLVVLVTGVFGGWLAKREGFHLLRELSAELKRGLPPGDRLTEGALVVVGGILLVTPGVLTDLVGVLLMVRPTRRWLAPRVLGALTARFGLPEVEGEDLGDGVRVRTAPARSARAAPRPAAHPFASKFDDLP